MEACSKNAEPRNGTHLGSYCGELLRIDSRNLVNEKSHKIFN